MAVRGKKKRTPPRSRPARTRAPAKAASVGALQPLIVGIGASAGGLEAFRAFFTHVPEHSGLAFVLVQHLAPDRPSMLVDLLRRHTSMPVQEGTDGARVEPNTIHVIPPNATLTIQDRRLHVSTPAPPRQSRRPIDTFFAALALDVGEAAVCIVLSGTGTDGTVGLRAIKEHGGLTLAQSDTDTAVTSAMPQSAVATGLVDHLMPVAEMPALLMDYQRHLGRVLPHKDGDGQRRDMREDLPIICELVRHATGHDFSQYKEATLLRRIQRRMQVLRVDEVAEFIRLLRGDPQQLDLLFREFLIGVTQFFRDPRTFEALRTVALNAILKEKTGADALRIWVPGCATGEEVYSLAIMVREMLDERGLRTKVQVFGSDIDEVAVAIARAGRYRSRLEGISAARLKRWFAMDGEDHCPITAIREMCVFAVHSAIKDPPFSRLDLISCRNLLIYFDADLQGQLLQRFHFALSPGGYLLLGQSETVPRDNKYFLAVDERHRIFRRRELSAWNVEPSRAAPPRAMPVPLAAQSSAASTDAFDTEIRGVLDKYTPVHVLIDDHDDIVRFSGGDMGRFLEPSAGAASLNLLTLVRKELRPAVRAALRQIRAGALTNFVDQLTVQLAGETRVVRLIIEPVATTGRARRWLAAFQELGTVSRHDRSKRAAAVSTAAYEELERELLATKTQLRASVDEITHVTEQMKSANEEFQSVNEELQSSNEELETAKEEMQSVNEELQTINAEMLAKNQLLTRVNSDLKNLLDSTHIATLFLDARLRIRNYTPGLVLIFRLRESDIGRPITDFAGQVAYGDLPIDVETVLRTLQVIEREVRSRNDERVLLMHIRPYLSVDNVLEGVVLTFIDITERKRHEEALARLAAIVDSSEDAIIGHTLDGTITTWNAGAVKIFGYTEEEAIGQPFAILIPQQGQDEVPGILQALARGEHVAHFENDRTRKDGTRIDVSVTVSPVKDAAGRMIAASTVAREITERKIAQEHQNVLMAELDHRVKNTLMIVNSLIAQTARTVDSPDEFARIIEGRIQALGRVHNLLHQNDWDRASLREVVQGELAPYRNGEAGRIVIGGAPEIILTARATQTLALALHELGTNAAKYGSLSTPTGMVEVRWSSTHASQHKVQLHWIESSGPRVQAPKRRGFGSELIERVVRAELHAEVQREFHAEGVRCTIEFPLTPTIGAVDDS